MRESTQEEWRDIDGYEGFYQVSNLGKIRSLHTKVPRLLKLSTTIHGYHRVELNLRGEAQKHSVHRLVALSFIPLIEDKNIVNHINNTRDDNRVENLEWCTYQENLLHASRQGRLPDMKGAKHNNSFLTDDIVIEIRRLAATKLYKQVEIGKMFGLDEKLISLIVLRKRWKHI